MNSLVWRSLQRLGVCLLFATAFYWPLWDGYCYAAAAVGYGLAVGLYLAIQFLTHFRHPLHGALIVVILAGVYSLVAAVSIAIGHMGR